MKRQILVAALLSCLSVFAAVARNQAKIDQVARGELKEARLSWWGFDEADSTAIIREALASKASTIIVDKMASPWITMPVMLHSDLTLVFEDGAEFLAKRGEFHGTNDSLINIKMINNVKIIGKGKMGVLRMWKSDYQKPPYRRAEWRHAVRILSSDNVLVKNMLMTESGGDGVYISAANETPNHHPRYVTIQDCVCDRNHRLGIGVVSAVDLLIENTKMTNTSGTAPMGGIDFEPNESFEPFINCVMRNCLVEGNDGIAATFYTPKMNTDAIGKMSFLLENCVFKGGCKEALHFDSHNWGGKEHTEDGDIVIKDCTFESDDAQSVVDMQFHTNHNLNFTFKDTKIVKGKGKGLPFVLRIAKSSKPTTKSTFTLDNMTVATEKDVPWLTINDNACVGVDNYFISGRVNHVLNGSEESFSFKVDRDYLKRYFPRRYFPEGAFCHKYDSRLKPAVSKPAAIPTAKIRHFGTFWLYADKGEKVDFTIHYEQLVRNKGTAHPLVLIHPSGKKVELGMIDFNTTKDFSFIAEEKGIHKLQLFVENNAACIDKCSVPAGLCLEDDSEFNLIFTTGDFYFYLPKGCLNSSVCLKGDGMAEGVNAKLFDPAGNVVFEGEDICLFTEIPVDNAKPGIWRLKIMRPTTIRLEDLLLSLVQIPPYLTNDPELLPVLP